MTAILSWAFLTLAVLSLMGALYLLLHPITERDAPYGHALVGILCAAIAAVLRMP